MQIYGFAPQVIDIIIAVVIYFAAFSLLLRGIVDRFFKNKAQKGKAAAPAPQDGLPEPVAKADAQQPKGGDNA